jgi:hypothetical protein
MGIFDGSGSMSEASEIITVTCEGYEGLNAGLPDQHHEIPFFIFGTDEKSRTSAKKGKITARLMKKRERELDIAIEGLGAAYRRHGRQFRGERLIGNIAKA